MGHSQAADHAFPCHLVPPLLGRLQRPVFWYLLGPEMGGTSKPKTPHTPISDSEFDLNPLHTSSEHTQAWEQWPHLTVPGKQWGLGALVRGSPSP